MCSVLRRKVKPSALENGFTCGLVYFSYVMSSVYVGCVVIAIGVGLSDGTA